MSETLYLEGFALDKRFVGSAPARTARLLVFRRQGGGEALSDSGNLRHQEAEGCPANPLLPMPTTHA